jgi:hypothetical protein
MDRLCENVWHRENVSTCGNKKEWTLLHVVHVCTSEDLDKLHHTKKTALLQRFSLSPKCACILWVSVLYCVILKNLYITKAIRNFLRQLLEFLWY